MIPSKGTSFSSYDIELKIAKILRVGVLVAGAFMAIGWLAQIDFNQNVFLRFSTYESRAFRETILALLEQQNWAKLMTYFGLIVLVSLPVLRVFFTFIVFARARERVMASSALLVLVGLAIGMMLGFAH